ncbi:MAG: Lrp/AsnC family transcriptional regulator, partial [Candidatus Bathyarchaeia archaeon]
MKLDKLDLKILRILQENCKLSAREIASELDVPITTVYSRIKRMEDSGLIKAYRALLDPKKIGKGATAFILASVAYTDPRRSDIISQRE